jgi:leucyl-tRNA synthetase
MSEWVNTTCPVCGGPAKRETDVMPQWAGSSWYYLRYADPKNAEAFASPEKLKYWTPVDWYNGGMEHTTLHLLYSRFWHKALFDLGLVPTNEPYAKRTSHGLILAEGGEKMSKSKGNTVSPDTLVETFGADSLRLYEMFIGPFDQPVAWNTNSVMGVRRFLERVWSMQEKVSDAAMDGKTETLLHQTIEKVTKDIENLKMNTAVSSLMIFSNHLHELEQVPKAAFGTLIKLLNPFAPHMAAEIASIAGYPSGAVDTWPAFDPSKIVATSVIIAVQINGKVRASITLSPNATEEEALTIARANENVMKWLDGTVEKRAVYVAGKIINFVVV